MFKPTYIGAALYLYLVGMGIWLLAVALTRRKPGFRLVRTAMGLCGPFATILGTVGFVRLHTTLHFSDIGNQQARVIEQISGGAMFSLLLLLVVSPDVYSFLSCRPPSGDNPRTLPRSSV